MTITASKVRSSAGFLILCILFTLATVGNLKVSIGQTSSDDGLIAHALAYANPQDFRFDSKALSFAAETPLSLLNFLPALALKYFHVDPIYFWIFFICLQICALVSSVFLIAMKYQKSKLVALFITTLFVSSKPYYWNLSNTGDFEWMPYAAHLVFSLFFLALAFGSYQRYKSATLIFTILPLIHPSLGIWTSLFFVTGILILGVKKILKWTEVTKLLAIPILPWSYLVITYLNVRSNLVFASDEKYVAQTVQNWNFQAGNLFNTQNNSWPLSMASLGLLVIGTSLTILLLRIPTLRAEQNLVVAVFAVITLIGLALHWIGLWSSNIAIVRLFGARPTMLLQGLIFLNFLICLTSNFEKHPKFLRWIMLGFLISPGVAFSALAYTFYLFRLLTLESMNRVKMLLISITVLGWSFILFPSVSRVSSGEPIEGLKTFLIYTRLFANNLVIGDLTTLLKLIAGVLFFILILNLNSLHSRQMFWITGFSTVLIIFGTQQVTAQRQNQEIKNFSEVQNWAHKNTTPNSLFILDRLNIEGYVGWRNLSRRPLIQLEDTSSPYLYLESDKDHNRALRRAGVQELDALDGLIVKMKLLYPIDYVVSTRNSNYKIVREIGKFKIYEVKAE